MTALGSIVFGGSLAWLEYYWGIKPARWFMALMTLPIFLPTVLVGLGFVLVLGRAGYVNDLLIMLHLPTQHLLYSPLAIILSHWWYNVPLAYLAVRLRLNSLPRSVLETSQVLGARWWQYWPTVLWPRLHSTVISIGCIIFLYAFVSFALPLLLGGWHYQTVEVYLYTLITQQFNIAGAAYVAGLQSLMLLVVLLYAQRFWKTTIELERTATILALTSGRYLIRFLRLSCSLIITAPVLAVVINSWQRGVENYIQLWHSSFNLALIRTITIAIIVIVTTTILAVELLQLQQRFGRTILLLILTISPVTAGLLWFSFTGKSLTALTIAYSILYLPLAYTIISNRWASRPPQFMTMAQILGANRWQTRWLQWRWLQPAIVQLTILGYAFVVGEYALALLLTPFQQGTAVVVAMQWLSSYHFGITTAGLTIIVMSMMVFAGIILALQKLYDSHS